MFRALHFLNSGKFLPAHFFSLLSPPKWQPSSVLTSLLSLFFFPHLVSSVKLLIGVHAFAQVVNINVKHYWPWYQPLSNTMSNGPPVVLLTSYYYSLCLTIQTVIHSPFTQLIWSICHQCRYKDIMGHLAKIFAKSTSTALFLSSYHSRQSDLSGMICSWQICTG